MAAPIVFASAKTEPGSTGTAITPTLSTHAANDVLEIFVGNTGNAAWTAPAGWTIKQQTIIGTSANGCVGTLLYRKVLPGDTLPLASPVCNLNATVTRFAHCVTKRGADVEGVFVLPEWGNFGVASGTANPVRPASVTTLAPEMHVTHYYVQRAATNAPDPSTYTQIQESIASGTLVVNSSEKTVAAQNTVLSNQDASPTSGARWVSMIVCTPSPDYVYYRSGTQALQANSTNVIGTLPAGTSSSDWRTNKDVVKVVVQAAGNNIAIAPNVPADWTEITGFATNTSGNGTTVRQYWAYYDGSLSLQFNRPTSGEIGISVTTYRNCDQTNPIGSVNVRQNASSTTSTWDALTRSETKSTVTVTCVADGTPTYTAPSGWTERMDGNGIVGADQVFDAGGSAASASFTLSAANATAVGLVELLSLAGVPTAANFLPRRGSFGQDARLRR